MASARSIFLGLLAAAEAQSQGALRGHSLMQSSSMLQQAVETAKGSPGGSAVPLQLVEDTADLVNPNLQEDFIYGGEEAPSCAGTGRSAPCKADGYVQLGSPQASCLSNGYEGPWCYTEALDEWGNEPLWGCKCSALEAFKAAAIDVASMAQDIKSASEHMEGYEAQNQAVMNHVNEAFDESSRPNHRRIQDDNEAVRKAMDIIINSMPQVGRQTLSTKAPEKRPQGPNKAAKRIGVALLQQIVKKTGGVAPIEEADQAPQVPRMESPVQLGEPKVPSMCGGDLGQVSSLFGQEEQSCGKDGFTEIGMDEWCGLGFLKCPALEEYKALAKSIMANARDTNFLLQQALNEYELDRKEVQDHMATLAKALVKDGWSDRSWIADAAEEVEFAIEKVVLSFPQ